MILIIVALLLTISSECSLVDIHSGDTSKVSSDEMGAALYTTYLQPLLYIYKTLDLVLLNDLFAGPAANLPQREFASACLVQIKRPLEADLTRFLSYQGEILYEHEMSLRQLLVRNVGRVMEIAGLTEMGLSTAAQQVSEILKNMEMEYLVVLRQQSVQFPEVSEAYKRLAKLKRRLVRRERVKIMDPRSERAWDRLFIAVTNRPQPAERHGMKKSESGWFLPVVLVGIVAVMIAVSRGEAKQVEQRERELAQSRDNPALRHQIANQPTLYSPYVEKQPTPASPPPPYSPFPQSRQQ